MVETRGEFEVTDESARIDPAAVAALLKQAYWAEQRTLTAIVASLAHSCCLALHREGQLIGFVRALTDHTVNAYVCDFFVEPAFRGQGLGRWLFQSLLRHPHVAGTQKILLTRDAQRFYEACGFERHPYECMRLRP